MHPGTRTLIRITLLIGSCAALVLAVAEHPERHILVIVGLGALFLSLAYELVRTLRLAPSTVAAGSGRYAYWLAPGTLGARRRVLLWLAVAFPAFLIALSLYSGAWGGAMAVVRACAAVLVCLRHRMQ